MLIGFFVVPGFVTLFSRLRYGMKNPAKLPTMNIIRSYMPGGCGRFFRNPCSYDDQVFKNNSRCRGNYIKTFYIATKIIMKINLSLFTKRPDWLSGLRIYTIQEAAC